MVVANGGNMIVENMAKACQFDLNRLSGVEVDLTDIKTILSFDKDLYDQLYESYDFSTYDGSRGLDTYDRGYVMDAFAKFIGSDYWPCNGEHGSEYEQKFIEQLIKYSNGEK